MSIARAFALLLFLVETSCVAPLTREQVGNIHSVGVISLLGDRVWLNHERFFDGVKEKVPVPDSQFDAVAENAVIECAKTVDPTLAIKKIPIPKQALMDKLYDGIPALYNLTLSEIRPALSEWVKQNAVDAIVVVRAVNRQVPARGPSTYFAGVGLHQFLNNLPFVQVSAGIVVLDARTMEQITGSDFAPAGGEYPVSIENVGEQLAAGQRLSLIPTLQHLLQQGVCQSIKRVNL
jgi:hypothetical protein